MCVREINFIVWQKGFCVVQRNRQDSNTFEMEVVTSSADVVVEAVVLLLPNKKLVDRIAAATVEELRAKAKEVTGLQDVFLVFRTDGALVYLTDNVPGHCGLRSFNGELHSVVIHGSPSSMGGVTHAFVWDVVDRIPKMAIVSRAIYINENYVPGDTWSWPWATARREVNVCLKLSISSLSGRTICFETQKDFMVVDGSAGMVMVTLADVLKVLREHAQLDVLAMGVLRLWRAEDDGILPSKPRIVSCISSTPDAPEVSLYHFEGYHVGSKDATQFLVPNLFLDESCKYVEEPKSSRVAQASLIIEGPVSVMMELVGYCAQQTPPVVFVELLYAHFFEMRNRVEVVGNMQLISLSREVSELLSIRVSFDSTIGLFGELHKGTRVSHVEWRVKECVSHLRTHEFVACRLLAFYAGMGQSYPYLSRNVVDERFLQLAGEPVLERIKAEVFNKWSSGSLSGRPPYGMVLYGPPGTGKTHLVEQLCAGSDGSICEGRTSALGFYVIKMCGASALQQPLVGQTEEQLRKLADQALERPEQMCVIFFDEYEVIAESRETTKQDYKASYVGQLLAIIGQSKYPNLFVIGCTNYMSKLDVALLRPGRQDVHILIGPLGLPASAKVMRELLIGLHSSLAQQAETCEQLVGELVMHAINFSHAQLRSVLNHAINEYHASSVKGLDAKRLQGFIEDSFRLFITRRCPENLRFNRLVSGGYVPKLGPHLRSSMTCFLSQRTQASKEEARLILNEKLGTLRAEHVPDYLVLPTGELEFIRDFPQLLASQGESIAQVVLLDAEFYLDHEEDGAMRFLQLLSEECLELSPSLVVIDVAGLIGWQVSSGQLGVSRGSNTSLAEGISLSEAHAITSGTTTTKGVVFGKTEGSSDSKTQNIGWTKGTNSTSGGGRTIGSNRGSTTGTSQQSSTSDAHGTTRSTSKMEGKSTGSSTGDSTATSKTVGTGKNVSTAKMRGHNNGTGESHVLTDKPMLLARTGGMPMPEGPLWYNESRALGSNTQSGDSTSNTTTDGTSTSESNGTTRTTSKNMQNGNNSSESKTDGVQDTKTTSKVDGTNASTTTGTSEAGFVLLVWWKGGAI